MAKMFGVPRILAAQFSVQQIARGMEHQHGIAINNTFMRNSTMRTLLAFILVPVLIAISSVAFASPCDGVDRQIDKERKVLLEPVIAKQLQVSKADVLQSYRMDNWSIIYVDTHEADEAFLFYAGDPLSNHFITLWSGGASSTEEQEIKKWVIKNATGIPIGLANCFAWHVTKDRDM